MSIRRILIIDTETTSTDPTTGACIEIAAAIYDIAHAAIVDAFSALLRAESNAAEHVNHIAPELVLQGREPGPVWKSVLGMLARCEAWTAYNLDFDRQWVPPEVDGARPDFCSMRDVEWPCGQIGSKLAALAADHGVAVANAHRALGDVWLLASLFSRVDELHRLGRAPRSLAEVVDRALMPRVLVVGDWGYDPKTNEKAKAEGFGFDGATRRWTKRVIATEAEEYAKALPFRVRIERPEVAA